MILNLKDHKLLNNKPTSSTPLSFEETSHLSYLSTTPSLFKNEYDKKMEQMNLICDVCEHPITKVMEKVDIFGRHEHAFRLYGDTVHLGCFCHALGCTGVRMISNGYSWFRGYSWQIQVCRECHTQLGWEYTSPNDSFYGLMFDALREEKPGLDI